MVPGLRAGWIRRFSRGAGVAHRRRQAVLRRTTAPGTGFHGSRPGGSVAARLLAAVATHPPGPTLRMRPFLRRGAVRRPRTCVRGGSSGASDRCRRSGRRRAGRQVGGQRQEARDPWSRGCCRRGDRIRVFLKRQIGAAGGGFRPWHIIHRIAIRCASARAGVWTRGKKAARRMDGKRSCRVRDRAAPEAGERRPSIVQVRPSWGDDQG